MMKMSLRMVPDRARVRNVLTLPGIGSAVDGVARDISTEASNLANSEARDDGDYAGSFEVSSGSDRDRRVAAVSNDDPAALHIEFGTRYIDAKGILRRAAERHASTSKPTRRGR